MPSGIIFFGFIFIPIAMLAIFILPLYLGMVTSIYWYSYINVQSDGIVTALLNVEYVVNTFLYLTKNAAYYHKTLGIMDYTLPIFFPVIIGILISVYFMRKFINYVRNVFILTV